MDHYTPQTVDFLWGLRLNNNKEWFLAHKKDYETRMLQPTKALANALFDHLTEAVPKHDWNLHISRIYRDARRLYGRGPMNDHLWFTLWADREEGQAPAFYFSFFPEGYHYGMGLWSQSNVLMERLRAEVRRNPAPAETLAWQMAAQDRFLIDGPKYKKHRVDTTPLLQDWTDRKYLGFHREQPHGEEGFDPDLWRTVAADFDRLLPLYEYFAALPELEEHVL